MKKRSGSVVMGRLIGLVKPLAGFMVLAVLMGLAGHLCACFITILGGCAVLEILTFDAPVTPMLAYTGAVCAPSSGRSSGMESRAATTLLPSSCWH